MKILYFGSNYSFIYDLWHANLLHKDVLLASSVAQAKFYIENNKIDLLLMAHEDNSFHYRLVDGILIEHKFIPIILCPKEMAEVWYKHLLVEMKKLKLYVCYVNPTNPRDIVKLIKMKELHGMSFSEK